jgi:hypothetical protein
MEFEYVNQNTNKLIIDGNNDSRRYDNISNIFQDTRTYIVQYEKTCEKNIIDNLSIGIYRYKFTNEFTDELYKFSKVHQYDHRKDFKEAWKIWTEDNSSLVDGEVTRLTNLGYDGDIIDKMYKSARYYFRKKSTEKKEPSKRRVYIGSQKELIEAMDEDIRTNIISGEFKPSNGFDEFCKKNVEIIKEQVNLLLKTGYKDSNEIKEKIKKTYKNRYFLIISK